MKRPVKNTKSVKSRAAELCRQAEEMSRKKASRPPEKQQAMTPVKMRQMLHELQVHQIELEMQKEELQLAQTELESARARYFDLYDLAPIGYCTLSEGGVILEANLTAATLLGVARNKLVKQLLTRFIRKEDQDIYYRYSKKLFDSGEPQTCDMQMVKKDGTTFWANLVASVAEGDDAAKVCRIIVKDITGRKTAEENLHVSEERFRLLSEAAFEAIVIHEDGLILNANDQYFKMFGYEPDEALGKEMISATFAPEVLEFVKKQIAADRLGPYEAIGIRKDGTKFPIEIRARKMEYKGRIVRFGAILDITERKKTEAALRESEEKYRMLADQSIMGMFIIQDGYIKYTNYATSKINGYSVEEMLEWKKDEYSIVLHPDDLPFVMEQVRRKQTGDPDIVVNYTWRIITKSGETKWVESFSKTISFRGSSANFVMMIDITEGKTAQEELQKSEANFRLLAENAPDAIFIRTKLKFAYVNNAALDLFGADSSDQLIGQSVMDRFHPDSRELILKNIHHLDEKKLSVPRNEQKYLKLDGTTIYVEVSAVPFRYENIDGSLVFVRDITERKKAEKDLRDSEELFKNLFRYHAAVKLIIDPDTGNIIDANEAAVKYYGWPHEEIIHMKIQDINTLSPEEVKSAMEKVKTSKRYSFEFHHRRADGSVRDVELFSSNIKVQGKDILHSVIFDITERKRAEGELKNYREHLEELVHERTIKLEAANKELEAFSYSASHDLRAPLRTIDGFSQALLEDFADKLNTQGKDYLTRIRKATRLMAELIEDMMKLSRITRTDMDIATVDLSRIARSVIGELEKSQPERNINIKIADDLEVSADSRLMRIVFENLMGNAWKFTGKKTPAEIEFGTTTKDGKKVFFIRDNGVGFDMAYASKLFAPFQRLHNAEEYPGTGIGLATVQRIINRHGGKVWAEGKTGEGATFYLSLHDDEGPRL